MSEPAVPSVPATATAKIAYYNRRSDFIKLVVRGALLELVTVGFYRFWLATDMRRHLWSHTAVEGDTLEYTGTAKELLFGFLFAIAILVPVYLIYFLISLEAERLLAFASFPLGVFFYLFTQFAVYRARRYRLTRTIWRGVRFWMSGSGWNYAWRAALWTLFAMLTLGFALPWRQAALERFKMRHISYGNLPGAFVGTGTEFFKRGWGLWLLLVLVPVSLAALATTKLIFLAVIYSIGVTVAAPFIYAIYRAIEWRWWISGIRLGDVSFESNMHRNALIDLYWKVIGWSLLFSSAAGIWGSGIYGIALKANRSAAANPEQILAIMPQYSVLIPVAIGYVAYVLAFWALMRIYLIHDVWQRVAESVTVYNLAAADDVVAQGKLVGALGEGFADSLDVVGF